VSFRISFQSALKGGAVSENALKRIDIVLCRPRYGGNIGSAARIVKNMGLGGLCLVLPEEAGVPEARMLAASAVDVLEKAGSFDTLEESIEGRDIVLGVSRRVKSARARIMTPREAARHVIENMGSGNAALVFGPEDSGLTAEELAICHGIVSIPASEEYPSLNLAQAVAVLAYDLRMAAGELPPVRSFGAPTEEETLQMFHQLMAVIDRSGFTIRNPREKVLLHMREILSRGVQTSQDARIIRGVFRRIAWAIEGLECSGNGRQGEET
jgi:TrmH family RNA methyltransferase